MSWPYAYTPYILPPLAAAALGTWLSVYAWRRRHVPAAVPFAVMVIPPSLWALASALELAAVDAGTKFLWYQVQASLKLLAGTCALIFVLAYAGLDKWLARKNLVLLALPCIVEPILIATNPAHHLFWPVVTFGQHITVTYGLLFWVLTLYTYLLFLLQVGLLVWLWIHSPLLRWTITLVLGAMILSRIAFVAETAGFNPFTPLDPALLFTSVIALVFFFAVFRLHFLDLVPVGRETAMERMANGVLILDVQDRIADLNLAAEKVLTLGRAATIGCPARQVLAAHSGLMNLLGQEPPASAEISLEAASQPNCFLVQVTNLTHPRGLKLGRLVLLQDITEQKRMRELVAEQQRALAALQERELLARELHDTLSQELAFMNVQAQATHELLQGGDTQRADEYVLKLASVARQAQVDARDLVSGLKTLISPEAGFLPSVRRFLDQFCRTYGIATEVSVTDKQSFPTLAPTVQVQLLRIIQEALTNIRKHAQAQHARLRLNTGDDWVEVEIEDDGIGFDPAAFADASGHFGLRIMRERAASIGGVLDFLSAPGTGTRVVVRVPVGNR